MSEKPLHERLHLPYQRRYLDDKSLIKIAEKSRRIGWTWTQSWEDVDDCINEAVPQVWFSSADDSAAKEYIEYVGDRASFYNQIADYYQDGFLDENKDITTYTVKFKRGQKITAMSSNPKGFRSKGGKVILDEFAWHEQASKLWAAARPVITWGFPLRIFSTHNGKNSLFNQFIERINAGKLNWSLHTVDIYKAVEEGLLDKITKRSTSAEERQAWIESLHSDRADEQTWLQEYCCIPTDENTAFLDYDLIASCTSRETLWTSTKSIPDGEQVAGELYLGMDIGRFRDLTVIWIFERLGDVLYTRKVIILDKMPFQQQRDILYTWLRHPKLRRACIDASGLGMQLAEEAQTEFGKYRVEAIRFTAQIKEELAYPFRSTMEDRKVILPYDDDVREDFHSIRKVTTAAGNVRFDVTQSDTSGHADRFWAAALGAHAAADSHSAPVRILTSGARDSHTMIRGYM